MIPIRQHKAQTAIELAVFGAILIFALGLTIRSATSRSQQQHSMLKATRLALTLSYMTSDTLKSSARNNATVLIVEDRLTADSGKYGPIERIPTLMEGSGMHTANLFMPINFGRDENVPLLDVFVNGKHFPFTTAAFKKVKVYDAAGNCWQDVYGIQSPMTCPAVEANCLAETLVERCANNAPLCTSGDCADCSAASTEVFSTLRANFECAKLFTVVDNHPLIGRWCIDNASCNPATCTSSAPPPVGCSLDVSQRFDLDRNDLDGIPGNVSVPPGDRANFSWQWYQVSGYDASVSSGASIALLNIPRTFRPRAVRVLSLQVGEGIDVNNGINTLLDVDDDLKLERIMGSGFDDNGDLTGGIWPDSNGVVQRVDVMDFQDGDVDFSINDSDPKEPPGFLNDVTLYSYVHDAGPGGGTYFRIEEGQLFSGDQFIRTTSKKDKIDIIERVFRISNNTGRFCGLAGGRRFWPTPNGPGPGAGKNYNPVEKCGSCFISANITDTCLDTATLLLYVRSRISNLQGRRWVTDRGTDPYVPFVR